MSARPTDAQIRMMRSVRDHANPKYHLRGRSEHGGGETTLGSLLRRKWVMHHSLGWTLTEAGVAVLDAAKGGGQ